MYSEESLILVIDLLEKVEKDKLDRARFDYHVYEVQKIIRMIIRTVNNSTLSQLVMAVSIWMTQWLDSIIHYQDTTISTITGKSESKIE